MPTNLKTLTEGIHRYEAYCVRVCMCVCMRACVQSSVCVFVCLCVCVTRHGHPFCNKSEYDVIKNLMAICPELVQVMCLGGLDINVQMHCLQLHHL